MGARHWPIWRKPITLTVQLEEIHVKPSDIKWLAVSHSHPDHAGNIEMFPNTQMLVHRPRSSPMDKIAAIIAKEHAQLWINHDQPQSEYYK